MSPSPCRGPHPAALRPCAQPEPAGRRSRCCPGCRAARSLGTCAQVFPSRAAVGCVTFGRRSGTPAPKRPLSGGVSRAPPAMVPAAGPAGLGLRDRAMGRPPCAAPGGPDAPSPRTSLRRGLPRSGSHAVGGPCGPGRSAGEPAMGRGVHRNREDGVGRWPPPAPGRPESPRTCEGPETGFVVGRGEVRNRNCAPSGRGRRPAPALALHRCAPRACPASLCKPERPARSALHGPRARSIRWPGRVPPPAPRAAKTSPGRGWGSGLRAPYAFAASPGLLGAKPLCKP